MSVKTNKNIASEIAQHIYFASRDLQLGKISVVFVGSHLKMYCIELASPLLYIPE